MKSVPTIELTSINATAERASQTLDRSQAKASLGFVAALVANILWGASFIASKATLEAWGPLGASALRFTVASLLLALGLALAGRRIAAPTTLKAWARIAAVAAVGFGLLYPIQLAGLKFVSSGFSAAIMLTSPLFVILGGVAFLGEGLSRRKLVAVGLGIVGGLVLLGESLLGSTSMGPELLIGSALTLAASFCLAASALLTRKACADLDAGSLTFWTMCLGALMIGGCALIFEPKFSIASIKAASLMAWGALAFLAVVCSALCFFLWNFALSKASPQEIASTMHIKTPTAIFLGAALASEPITASLIAGTILVSVGVYLSQKKDTGGKRS
jgi:drug/metabolite transporter (DMT)-like permease